jgi:hypothetical protein
MVFCSAHANLRLCHTGADHVRMDIPFEHHVDEKWPMMGERLPNSRSDLLRCLDLVPLPHDRAISSKRMGWDKSKLGESHGLEYVARASRPGC